MKPRCYKLLVVLDWKLTNDQFAIDNYATSLQIELKAQIVKQQKTEEL